LEKEKKRLKIGTARKGGGGGGGEGEKKPPGKTDRQRSWGGKKAEVSSLRTLGCPLFNGGKLFWGRSKSLELGDSVIDRKRAHQRPKKTNKRENLSH